MAQTLDVLRILYQAAWDGSALRSARGMLDNLGKAAAKAGISIDMGLVAKLGALAVGLKAAQKAAQAAYNAFQDIRELGREGAAIEQMSLSFEGLNRRILKTPSLLADMQAGVKGTISEYGTMSSFMTLTAGVSDTLSRAFAQNAGELAEIAKAASKLNPALGDTNYMFESLALGIKRGSFRMLDNLGLVLKMGELYRDFAQSVGKSVLELTAEEKQLAILQGTLQAGQNLIRQAGGNADSLTDSYDRLTASWENFTNALKVRVARVVEASGMIENLATSVSIMFQALEIADLNKQVQALGGEGVELPWLRIWAASDPRTSQTARDALLEDLGSLRSELELMDALLSGRTDFGANELGQLAEILRRTNPELKEFTGGLTAVDMYGETFQFMPAVFDKAVAAFNRLINGTMGYVSATSHANDESFELAGNLQGQTVYIRNAAGSVIAYKEAGDELFTSLLRQNEGSRDLTASNRRLNTELVMMEHNQRMATQWTDAETSALHAQSEAAERNAEIQKAYWAWYTAQSAQRKTIAKELRMENERLANIASRESAGATFRDLLDPDADFGGFFTSDVLRLGPQRVSTMTADQREELERLRGTYETTERQIRDYTAGILGAGLTEERRAEKLEELQGKLTAVQTAMDPLIAAQGEYVMVNNKAIWSDKRLQDELFNLTMQANPTGAALLGLAAQTGRFSEEQAWAMLKTEAMRKKLEFLAGEVANNNLTWEEAIQLYKDFQDELANPLTLEIFGIEQLDYVNTTLGKLKETYGGTGASLALWIDVNYNDPGWSPPTGYQWTPEGTRGGAAVGQHGGWVHAARGSWVPGPWIPADRVPALLTGGERVASRAEVSRAGGIAAVDSFLAGANPRQQRPVNVTINAYGSMAQPKAIANEIVRRITVGG